MKISRNLLIFKRINFKNILVSTLSVLFLVSCAQSNHVIKAQQPDKINTVRHNKIKVNLKDKRFENLILSKQSGSIGSQKVLQIGRKMALETQEIVKGSCWDFIDTVYNRAGFPNKDRRYILKGKYKRGPYAKPNDLQAGDWMYYINHSYKNIQHSGIFVGWTNKAKRKALVLSYPGQNKKKPGRYREYDLSHVYTIIRPKG